MERNLKIRANVAHTYNMKYMHLMPLCQESQKFENMRQYASKIRNMHQDEHKICRKN